MAGNYMTVNTDQVAQIANNLEGLNNRLNDELTEAKVTIDNLANVWQGEASQDTIASFDEFANKYFKNYHDIIADYVKFLRVNVDQGYFETEKENVKLADAFK